MSPIALSRDRVLKGFFTAPIAAPIVFTLLATIWTLLAGFTGAEWKAIPASLLGALVWFPLGVAVSYVVTAVLGVPAFILMRRFHRPTVIYWIVAAGLIGLAAGLLATLAVSGWSTGSLVGLGAFGAVGGALTGWLFWQVAVKPPNSTLHRTRA